jgi:hypothetical protein
VAILFVQKNPWVWLKVSLQVAIFVLALLVPSVTAHLSGRVF